MFFYVFCKFAICVIYVKLKTNLDEQRRKKQDKYEKIRHGKQNTFSVHSNVGVLPGLGMMLLLHFIINPFRTRAQVFKI